VLDSLMNFTHRVLEGWQCFVRDVEAECGGGEEFV
jgi:hypothetical protein